MQLSDADDLLNKEYKQALHIVPDKDKLIKSQKQWIKTQRNKCTDVPCLIKVYQERISLLKASYSTPVSAEDNITGEYRTTSGLISVQLMSDNKIKFQINTVNGMNVCNIGEDGGAVATLTENNRAVFTDDEKCEISLIFDKNKLTAASKNCSGYCGLNVTFDGTYLKKSESPGF